VDGLRSSRAVLISPDSKHVYATGFSDDAISVFERNLNNGSLTYKQTLFRTIDGITGFDGPTGIRVSNDGKFVYVATAHAVDQPVPGSVAVFSRNESTGLLSYVGSSLQGDGLIDGIAGATDIRISSDDKFLYVTGFNSDAVAVFSRNQTTGLLTFVEAHFDGVDGVTGLVGAWGLTFTENGQHLYVASLSNSSLVHFAVNQATGKLTFVKSYVDGQDGIEGLGGASRILIHESGYVLVTGSIADSIVVFLASADPDDGALTFVEAIYDGQDGVTGLAGSNQIAASPDGAHIYVTARLADKIATFGFTGCFSSLGGTLRLKKKAGKPKASTMVWKWLRGAETDLLALGDPRTQSDYTLSVLDATGEKLSLDIPSGTALAGTPWTEISRGYRFSDSSGSADGARRAVLQSGDADRSKVTTLHRGINLELPSDLAMSAPVTVRLRNNDPASLGACWENRFTAEGLKSSSDLLVGRMQ
jgi:6-phosphogluconolactonase (cycloisomerase 2 family)